MDGVPVGRRLKAARELAGGLTVPELAERLALPGLGAKTLGAIERGERDLRPHEAQPIAAALGVPAEFLTGRGEAHDAITAQLIELRQAVQGATELGMIERSTIMGLLERQSSILAGIEALLARQDRVLASIEAAIVRERAASKALVEEREASAERLAGVLREIQAAAESLERAPAPQTTPASPAG